MPPATFEHVWGRLQAGGWLQPIKLRTLQERDVAHLLRLTLEELGGDVDEILYDSLLEWLSSEAKLARSSSHAIVEEEVLEVRASIYK